MLRPSILLLALFVAACVAAPAQRGRVLGRVAQPDPELLPLHAQLLTCGPSGAPVAGYSPYFETRAGQIVRNPTDAACLSSGYGLRTTASGGGRRHTGIDLANSSGGRIGAAADGRVLSVGWRGDYGLTVEIDHGNGVLTRYAHLSSVLPELREGRFLIRGEPIGMMGSTGNATGVHLHYEVVVDGVEMDPLE